MHVNTVYISLQVREEGKAVLKQISQLRGINGSVNGNVSVEGILCRQQTASMSWSAELGEPSSGGEPGVGSSSIKKSFNSSTESQSNMDTEEPPMNVGPIKLNFSPNQIDESDTSNIM